MLILGHKTWQFFEWYENMVDTIICFPVFHILVSYINGSCKINLMPLNALFASLQNVKFIVVFSFF